jgi:hypothetical protein
MNIIEIASPHELPSDVEYYIFDSEKDLEFISPDATVYKVTRLHPKEYVEYYVVNEEKK